MINENNMSFLGFSDSRGQKAVVAYMDGNIDELTIKASESKGKAKGAQYSQMYCVTTDLRPGSNVLVKKTLDTVMSDLESVDSN